jgi:hypothetical protein
MKGINAGQAKVIMDGLGAEIWDELAKHGYLQGGGIYQEEDGELTIHASYKVGTMTSVPPTAYKGFRIVCEERQPAKLA